MKPAGSPGLPDFAESPLAQAFKEEVAGNRLGSRHECDRALFLTHLGIRHAGTHRTAPTGQTPLATARNAGFRFEQSISETLERSPGCTVPESKGQFTREDELPSRIR